MKDNTKVNNSRLGSIWLTVLLLGILVLASAALLANFIKRYTKQEKNVITIMAEGNAVKNEYDDTSLPAGANPEMEPSWETNTSVDLFKTMYTDAEGNITVKSSKGDKIIAPGTTNEYEFTLKNTGNISLDYKLELDGVFKISDNHLPFYVRIHNGDRWLVGDENEWVHAEQMKTLVENATLLSGETATYIFEWQWPYEIDDESQKLINDLNDTLISADINDTKLGSIALGVDADFYLNIVTTSVVTPNAIPAYNDGTRVITELLFVTAMCGLILLSGIWLILIFFRRQICFTGIIDTALNSDIKLGRAKTQITQGRFVFQKARFGKHKLVQGTTDCVLRFQSGKCEAGICFEQKEESTIIVIDRKIRVVELYVTGKGEHLSIDTARWAVIDKKHNIYTPAGIVPPQDGSNVTPSGLRIDKQNRIHY